MIPDRTPPETIPAEVLARSQRHYDALLNGLATVVWEMDAATLRLTFTSRNIEAVFGHAYECWVQDRNFWVKRLHPEDRSRALEACTRAIALRRSCTLEYRMLRADGRAVWIRDLVSFATGPGGRDLLRGVMLDITEGREAEEALISSATVDFGEAARGAVLPRTIEFGNDGEGSLTVSSDERLGRTGQKTSNSPRRSRNS